MYMTEEHPDMTLDPDYRGKTALVSTHLVVEHIEQIREDLRGYVVTLESGHFRLSGFVLGKIMDVSIHGHYWIEFPWVDSPVQVHKENVLKILLDDGGEPDLIQLTSAVGEKVNLPRLVP